ILIGWCGGWILLSDQNGWGRSARWGGHCVRPPSGGRVFSTKKKGTRWPMLAAPGGARRRLPGRRWPAPWWAPPASWGWRRLAGRKPPTPWRRRRGRDDGLCRRPRPCLLYTSDAADEEDSVDLGGRRI